jgi:UDP-N-acetylmuramate--alanine ligase
MRETAGMKLPNEIGPIHFVGIGGIGMSGIAEVLINLGRKVQGSDLSDNANVKLLREKGATLFIGHDAANLGAAAVVVVSSAVKRDNPELVAARAARSWGASRESSRGQRRRLSGQTGRDRWH